MTTFLCIQSPGSKAHLAGSLPQDYAVVGQQAPPWQGRGVQEAAWVPAASASEEGVLPGESKAVVHKADVPSTHAPGTDTPGETLLILPTRSSENNCTDYLPSFRNRQVLRNMELMERWSLG